MYPTCDYAPHDNAGNFPGKCHQLRTMQ